VKAMLFLSNKIVKQDLVQTELNGILHGRALILVTLLSEKLELACSARDDGPVFTEVIDGDLLLMVSIIESKEELVFVSKLVMIQQHH
jgi:hypothetical protein